MRNLHQMNQVQYNIVLLAFIPSPTLHSLPPFFLSLLLTAKGTILAPALGHGFKTFCPIVSYSCKELQKKRLCTHFQMICMIHVK